MLALASVSIASVASPPLASTCLNPWTVCEKSCVSLRESRTMGVHLQCSNTRTCDHSARVGSCMAVEMKVFKGMLVHEPAFPSELLLVQNSAEYCVLDRPAMHFLCLLCVTVGHVHVLELHRCGALGPSHDRPCASLTDQGQSIALSARIIKVPLLAIAACASEIQDEYRCHLPSAPPFA